MLPLLVSLQNVYVEAIAERTAAYLSRCSRQRGGSSRHWNNDDISSVDYQQNHGRLRCKDIQDDKTTGAHTMTVFQQRITRPPGSCTEEKSREMSQYYINTVEHYM